MRKSVSLLTGNIKREAKIAAGRPPSANPKRDDLSVLRSGRRDQDQKVRRKSVSGSRWRYSEIDGRRSQDGQIFLRKADRLTIVYNGYEPASMGIRMPDTGKMPSRHAP